MSTSLLYHTQGIQDFQHLSFEYSGKYLIWNIVRKADKFKCSVCLSSKAKVVRYHERDIRGLPMGNKILILMILNLGTTSFKFKLFDFNTGEEPVASGMVERIGAAESGWSFTVGDVRKNGTAVCDDHKRRSH